jgi:catechol 2,3-dioxygenase-like lactoylglutathione lyase family enzyme
MPSRLAYTTLLVDEYDPALEFFQSALRFVVLRDEPLGGGKRWVVVAPSQEGGALLLARAATPDQVAMIGKQGGGRVWLFLHTDDFQRDYQRLQAHGVRFEEAPRDEAYGRVVVFVDPWGNRWDLIQPKA